MVAQQAPAPASTGAAADNKWAKFLPEPKQVEFTATLCADKEGMMTQAQVKLFLRGMGLTIRENEFAKKIFSKATTSHQVQELSPNKQSGTTEPNADSLFLGDPSSVKSSGDKVYSKEKVIEWFSANKEHFQHLNRDQAEKALETLQPHVSGGAKDRVSLKLLKHVLANLGDDKIDAKLFTKILKYGDENVPVAELLNALRTAQAPSSYK
ncbi:unnamed protein product [Amoebophrya sp. A120]|nr:unnamed protein product [Amoebophrya sp. A120]|eukprot:GSA120T00020389001.1